MKHVQLICIFVGLVCTFSSSADVKISGYGSIIAGKTLGTVDDRAKRRNLHRRLL